MSSDRFFCDRCNGLLPYQPPAALPAQVALPDGSFVDCSGFSGVFPADCWRHLDSSADGGPCRVYALNRSWWRDLAGAVARRASVSLEILAPIQIVPHGDAALVVAGSLPGGDRPLARPLSDDADEFTRLEETLAGVELLARALEPLHAAGYVWLNFDPAGLVVAGDRIQVQALDLQLFTAGDCPPSLRLSPAYSAPEVCAFRGERIGPATDVFHVALHAYYRLGDLLPGGLPGNGLEAFGFDLPPLRIYRPGLPAGITPVLARGLARDPDDRFASMADFVSALDEAVARARARARSSVAIAIDPGAATATGLVHVREGLPNQDACTILSVAPDTLLAIVADGVTHAQIGSGDVASRTAIEVLADTLAVTLRESTAADDLPRVLSAGCLRASEAILDRALAGRPAGETIDPVSVMSSTVVLAVVRGNELTLASAGDSRAYLICEGHAEQLTVDGDVRCTHLAAGLPPELVTELGPDAFALYTCLGIGEPGPEGRLVPCLERTRPRVTSWRLLPGDVVVLCSDGLVEEGVFLEPVELAALVAGEGHRPAVELAEFLVAAACGRHRAPSPWEPEGCGDDVTCIVLSVRSG